MDLIFFMHFYWLMLLLTFQYATELGSTFLQRSFIVFTCLFCIYLSSSFKSPSSSYNVTQVVACLCENRQSRIAVGSEVEESPGIILSCKRADPIQMELLDENGMLLKAEIQQFNKFFFVSHPTSGTLIGDFFRMVVYRVCGVIQKLCKLSRMRGE
uniref:Uncharacterized protein n=1 Tax=Meloidogyne enterolobii TaxID=390850 RepID=A0A6V7VP03_MELEN|nr:unnamed protein product [Meloidogyne enterolobii]